MQNGEHVIKEEDLEMQEPQNSNVADSNSDIPNNIGNAEKTAGISKDIYNSEPSNKKTKLLNKDFFKFFRLPLIIIALLIASVIVVKILFIHKSIPSKAEKLIQNKSFLADKKRFSPSVFNYAEKKPALQNQNGTGLPVNDKQHGNFNQKFKNETDKLSRSVKFNNSVNYSPTNGRPANDDTQNINKKTVVFIKASYGRYILNEERGAKSKNNNKNKIAKDGLRAVSKKETISFNYGAYPVLVPQGTVINAYTKYKIFSYNTAVPVIAIASSDFYCDGKPVIKKGDKFFGSVGVKHSLNRLNMNFNKIIEKKGNSISIDAIAMMQDGSGGVKGDVHRHYAGNLLTSIAQGIVGAASIFVGGGSGVNSSQPYTFQNQVRENIAQNELNSAQNGLNGYANSNQNISITLPSGTPIKIIFLKPVYANQAGF